MTPEMDCDHQECKETWVSNDPDSPTDGQYETEITRTTEDIDTHRYRCTQCGLVMYYSAAARSHYELGTPSDIPGLSG